MPMGLCAPVRSKKNLTTLQEIMSDLADDVAIFGKAYKETHNVDDQMANACTALRVQDAIASRNDMSTSDYNKFLVDSLKVHTSFMEYMRYIGFNKTHEIDGFLHKLKKEMKANNLPNPTVSHVDPPFTENISEFEQRACTYKLIMKYQKWVQRTNRELTSWIKKLNI